MPDETVEAVPVEETTAEVVETPEGFIALDKHQKDVNVQHKKYRDQERLTVKEQKRADELQAKLDAVKPAEVVVPPAPDPYSETYQADIEARDAAIVAKTAQDAANERAADAQKQKEEARAAEEQTALQQRVAGFESNITAHGLKPDEIKVAADAVIGFGINTVFQDVLLDDPDGPLLVKYLQENPVEADAMNRMSVMGLVNHINGDVRAKALLLKPQTSTAPEPPITLEGGGAPETKETWEQGAKYE